MAAICAPEVLRAAQPRAAHHWCARAQLKALAIKIGCLAGEKWNKIITKTGGYHFNQHDPMLKSGFQLVIASGVPRWQRTISINDQLLNRYPIFPARNLHLWGIFQPATFDYQREQAIGETTHECRLG